ncbi:SMI1/KNR4 family protein [Alloalcanivorax xenomutans]|uniref:SMI1/KNR4 family protein n=1 Tax=Alloalcanivorax xenomutans TaxID=1094342 RepID=UPI0029351482|nr:SMI1/KNR4 family protein [Alloalcanivorax xenomutans]WOD28988.1 SMI1/KNR4 family protein [Alloalcanivorax xenomutans]
MELIRRFSRAGFGLGESTRSHSEVLEKEKKRRLPEEFRCYIDQFAPEQTQHFTKVGNPLSLYGGASLSWVMDGYNFNRVINEPIEDWHPDWFLFADEGGDPVIVDLSERESNCTVYQAMHGAGAWDFVPIADSIGQFLVCSAAMHHALEEIPVDDPIIDDERGFNLCDQCADWLFPFMKTHAGRYYNDWVSVFDNH